mgnify:FL=1|tara:strand:+ start:2623 stop:2796 length:174 start_codon:yes stop_codon:yes gene_type:complete
MTIIFLAFIYVLEVTLTKIIYLQRTWENGKWVEAETSEIISESIRGFMDGYNVFTEI